MPTVRETRPRIPLIGFGTGNRSRPASTSPSGGSYLAALVPEPDHGSQCHLKRVREVVVLTLGECHELLGQEPAADGATFDADQPIFEILPQSFDTCLFPHRVVDAVERRRNPLLFGFGENHRPEQALERIGLDHECVRVPGRTERECVVDGFLDRPLRRTDRIRVQVAFVVAKQEHDRAVVAVFAAGPLVRIPGDDAHRAIVGHGPVGEVEVPAEVFRRPAALDRGDEPVALEQSLAIDAALCEQVGAITRIAFFELAVTLQRGRDERKALGDEAGVITCERIAGITPAKRFTIANEPVYLAGTLGYWVARRLVDPPLDPARHPGGSIWVAAGADVWPDAARRAVTAEHVDELVLGEGGQLVELQ